MHLPNYYAKTKHTSSSQSPTTSNATLLKVIETALPSLLIKYRQLNRVNSVTLVQYLVILPFDLSVAAGTTRKLYGSRPRPSSASVIAWFHCLGPIAIFVIRSRSRHGSY